MKEVCQLDSNLRIQALLPSLTADYIVFGITFRNISHKPKRRRWSLKSVGSRPPET